MNKSLSVVPEGKSKIEQSDWHVYILRCADDSLYTGITTNLKRRVDEHNLSAKGASYTRGRRPVSLVFSMETPDRASASRLELQIKKLPRSAKQRLIETAHTPSAHRLVNPN